MALQTAIAALGVCGGEERIDDGERSDGNGEEGDTAHERGEGEAQAQLAEEDDDLSDDE